MLALILPVHSCTNMNPGTKCVQNKEDGVEKLFSCTGSNKFFCLNKILRISSKSSMYNIHNKIVQGKRIKSTNQTVVHDVWMKVLLMCSRPATFTGLSFTVSLIHKGMNVAALVHCIVVPLIIHSCACTAIHKA